MCRIIIIISNFPNIVRNSIKFNENFEFLLYVCIYIFKEIDFPLNWIKIIITKELEFDLLH